jgi:hypothetical protein
MPTELAKNAIALLQAIRAKIPGPIPSLTLDTETGQRLVVGLCEREPALQFQNYTLDAADLERPAADVAAEIATLREAARKMAPVAAVTRP